MILYKLNDAFEYRCIYLDDERIPDFSAKSEIKRRFRTCDPIDGLDSLDALYFRMQTLKETRESEVPRRISDARFSRGVADLARNTFCPTFSGRAISVLGDKLRTAGELLRCRIKEHPVEHYGFHCMREIDAVDLERSVGCDSRFYDDVFSLDKYVFHRDLIDGVDVFRTKRPHDYSIFVSHEFAELVREAGLSGFDFQEMWRSEDDKRAPVAPDEPLESWMKRTDAVATQGVKKRKKRKVRRRAAIDPEQIARRIHTPDDFVVVAEESVESDDPGDIVRSNMEFVDALRAEHVRDEEISRDALKSYMLVDFVYQVEDGGFAMFAYNVGSEEGAMDLARQAMTAVGAKATLAAFKGGEALLAGLSDEQRQQFFEGDYFGENEIRDELSAVDTALQAALEEEDLHELNAAWLRSLPTLMPVPEDQFAVEIQRRASAVPDPKHRQVESEESEPAEMRRSRELCKQAGLEFQGFTGMLPNSQHNGRVGIGIFLMTDAGPHQCVAFDDRVILVNSGTKEVVCEVEIEE